MTEEVEKGMQEAVARGKDAITEVALSEAQVAEMNAEYQLLLPKCIAIVKDCKISTAIAALVSAACCVGVENIPDQNAFRQYFLHCVSDSLARVPDAYTMKAIAGDENNELSKLPDVGAK